jgi:hypothetical protein
VAALKYPFYIVGFLFVVLTVYSVVTEKPRQFKAKPVDESVTRPLSEIWDADETSTGSYSNRIPTVPHGNQGLPKQGYGTPGSPTTGSSTTAPNDPRSKAASTEHSSSPANAPGNTSGNTPGNAPANNSTSSGQQRPKAEPAPAQSTSIVVAYSNNDAGGKIVLTLNKCEKLPGTVAYTTAPDGKVDYGCWTFDELYIVINWDKAGINNYTYDRFIDISTNEKLVAKHLFEVAKDSLSRPVAPQTTQTSPAINANGVKK